MIYFEVVMYSDRNILREQEGTFGAAQRMAKVAVLSGSYHTVEIHKITSVCCFSTEYTDSENFDLASEIDW